ncbi:MAG: hypothetical protein AAGA84_07025 [Pseudomonadota bacterium]
MIKLVSFVSAVLLVGLSASNAFATELNGELQTSVGYSQNLLREVEPPEEVVIGTVGLMLEYEEENDIVDGGAFLDFDYYLYDTDRVDNEWIGGAFADFDFTLVPERVTWRVSDNFGQISNDQFRPIAANNRENVNVFSTGPIIRLLPNGRNNIRLRAQYFRTDFEIQPNDSDRFLYGVDFVRTVGRGSEVDLRVSQEEIQTDSLIQPIDRDQVTLGWQKQGARTTLNARAGYTRIDTGLIEDDGLFLSVNMLRQTSRNGNLTMSARTQYSDQGDIFRALQNSTGAIGRTLLSTNTPLVFRDTNATLTYTYAGPSTTLEFTFLWNDEDFEGQSDLGNDTTRTRVSLRRPLGASSYYSLRFLYVDREYGDIDRSDTELSGIAEIGTSLGRHFKVSLDVSYWDRNSNFANAAFHEFRSFLRLSYVPDWLQ